MALRSPNINVMVTAAQKAGRKLIRDFGEVENLQVSKKGPADFVSNADTKAEKVIVEELSKARPSFGFLLEEAGEIKGTDPDHRWIVDPLDGTTNFLHGLPHFAVSIALEVRGELIAGVVYDPIKDEMFWGEKGAGTHINERRLRVSGRTRMDESIFATGIPFMGRGNHAEFTAQMAAVMAESAGIRRFGSAALDLAYVAAGRYDGFWESGLKPWDMAAGIVLVREAGGFITDMAGTKKMMERGDIVAANDRLQAPLHRLVAKAGKTKA